MARPTIKNRTMKPASPVRDVEHMVGSNGVKRVKITEHDDAVVLRALSRKWTSTQTRLDRDCETVKQTAEAQIRAMQVVRANEQRDFHAECGKVAARLGINMADESVTVNYDDETDCFVIEKKPVTGAPQTPVDDGPGDVPDAEVEE